MPAGLSKKETVKEIVKCGKDPAYFINNYARISHTLKGLRPFKTYPFQDDLLVDFNDYRFNVCLLYTSPSPRDRIASRMPSSA